MLEIDKKIFDENLLLTQQHCEMVLKNSVKNNAAALRTFNPEYNGQPIFSFTTGKHESHSWNSTIWSINPVTGVFANLYDELFEAQLIYKTQNVKPTDTTDVFKGRILVAEIDTTLLDGASEAESDGFIDIYDCPPIDTWFYKTTNSTGRVFYAWIPDQFIKLAQVGINVNALESFSWDEDFKLRKDYSIVPWSTYQTQFKKDIDYKKAFWRFIIMLILLSLINYLMLN